ERLDKKVLVGKEKKKQKAAKKAVEMAARGDGEPKQDKRAASKRPSGEGGSSCP
nr:hypothetical protein [Tanacetum cinerariifolium]